MTTITIHVSNKTAVCQKRYLISSNTGYRIKFVFDSEWEIFTVKTARIIFDTYYYDKVFTGDTVELPRIPPCKSLAVGVFTDNLATNAAELGCIISSADFDGEAVTEFTQSQYDQIVALLNETDLRQISDIRRDGDTLVISYNNSTSDTVPLKDGTGISEASVNESGSLILTLTDGNALNCGHVKGNKGDKGDKGDVGATPDLSIGTVTTASPDEPASASLSGTAENPVLNLRIPKGSVGDKEVNPDKTTWLRRSYHNIFNKNMISDGYFFYDTSSANLTGGGTANYFTSDYIPVLSGKVYRQNVLSNMNIKIFDESKSYLSTIGCSNYLVTVPDNGAYMRFSVNKGTMSADSVQVYEYLGETYGYSGYKTEYSVLITDDGYIRELQRQMKAAFESGKVNLGELALSHSVRMDAIKGLKEWHWNLVDADKMIDETQLSASDGCTSAAPDGQFISKTTPFIDVTGISEIKCLWQTLVFYDEEKAFISGFSQNELANFNGSITVPENAKYLRSSNYSLASKGYAAPSIFVRRYGQNDLIPASTLSYKAVFPMFGTEEAKNGFQAYIGVKKWADKKFVSIGDSFSAPGTWQSLMYENLLAVGVGNFSVSGGAWSDYDGVPKTAYEQAQELVGSGVSPDVILCTLGTNDAGNKRPVGNFVNSTDIADFDLTTFSGGFQATMNYLQNHFPDAIIFVGWTPMGGLAFDETAYIEKMKELCLKYGVGYIETRTCGITCISEVFADCYEKGVNGGHPTAKGQQKIAAYMTRLFS